MYAIVAAENTVARVMLKTTLERMAFTVDEARDELGAASLMARAPAPDLALLDFDTLRVSFREVCRALRALHPGVYVVALVPEDRSPEIGAALEAGADDFMLHSSSIQEVEGRLRVIARGLEQRGTPEPPAPDDEWLLALDEPPSETPLQRVELPPAEDAFMMMDVPEDAEPTEEEEPEEKDLEEKEETPSSKPVRLKRARASNEPKEHGLFEVLDFPGALGRALEELDLPPATPTDAADAAADSAFSAWSLIVARRGFDAFWCALQLDIDREPMDVLHRRILRRRPRSDDDCLRLLRQLMGLAQDALQNTGRSSRVFDVYVPRSPIARPTAHLPVMLTSTQADRRRFGLALGDALRLRLTVTMNLTHLQEQPLMQMRPYELLAAPLQTTDDLMLLSDGTLLDDSYIDKIQSMSYTRNLMPTIRVFPPPSSIAIFLRRLT